MSRWRLALCTLLAVLFTAVPTGATNQDAQCPRWRAAFAGMPVRTITVETSKRAVVLRVKVADTPEGQAGGFQCATVLEIQENLIVFDFGQEILTQFHMQNVRAPLDIAFAKATGQIFAVLRMEPSDAALYGPLGAFRYAIEARAGFFESRGIWPSAARLAIPFRR